MYIIPEPPVDEEIVGSSIPLGNSERTELTLAKTSAKAAFGSVFNFIFTVTVDVLGLELEDI